TEITLTETTIRTIFERERCRALAQFADWEHPFTSLRFNRARRAYGHAHQDGRIVLSNTFLGTTAVAELEDTIRHELAHLIAGIRFKHGPRWRQVASE
ncbi:MAG: SprT-like domain-containing protein, partial [Congregibacter sp.]|nr:SprT-like domain-containing protein [Congregibacter sp.]